MGWNVLTFKTQAQVALQLWVQLALQAYLECGALLVELHDHLLLALVHTASMALHGLLAQLHLPCLLKATPQGLHLTVLGLLQLQVHLQGPPNLFLQQLDPYSWSLPAAVAAVGYIPSPHVPLLVMYR